MDQNQLLQRVYGSLAAACIGDALGAPTEQRSIDEIRQLFGGRVERFFAPPADSPFSTGRHAGQITDDSSQMLHIVDAYIEGQGQLSLDLFVKHLLAWAADGQYFPRFAGLTTKQAIERLRAGEDPISVGKVGRLSTVGSSNGAAMRVAPAGLANPGDRDGAIRDAVTTCLATHATQVGISGAAAVAAAVAEAVRPGAQVIDVVRAARYGAAEGERIGREVGRIVPGPSVARRIDLALEIAARAGSLDEAVQELADIVGTGLAIAEAVPAAIGIFLAAGGDPLLCAIGGANAGDDTDTVACIAASIGGALRGIDALPADLVTEVQAANSLDLGGRARAFTSVIIARRGGR